ETARIFGSRAAFREDFAVDHVFAAHPEGFSLLDQYLNVSRNLRVHELVADLADIRPEQVRMATEESLVPLINNEMKIVDLDRIAVPVFPEWLDRLERQLAGRKIAHEVALEDFLLPARVHLLDDVVG